MTAPAPGQAHQLRQRADLRAGALDHLADRRPVEQAAHQGRSHILDPDRLETRAGPGQRHHRRQRLQPREQADEAVVGPEDHARTQDRQLQAGRAAQHLLAGGLAAQIARRGRLRIALGHAQRADMDEPRHARTQAGRGDALRQHDMRRLELRGAAVQDGHQIDHRIGALHQALERGRIVHVGGDALHRRQRRERDAPARAAARHDDGAAGGGRLGRPAGRQRAADKTGSAQDQQLAKGHGEESSESIGQGSWRFSAGASVGRGPMAGCRRGLSVTCARPAISAP